MSRKNWSRKPIAVCLSVAVLSVYSMIALASPGAKSGELSVSGQVTVNGQKVISGGTLFSDSAIATSELSSATVSISKLGRILLAPNTSMKLTFTDNTITGILESGEAQVSTLAGVSVNFATNDGAVVVDGSQATSFNVTTKNGATVVATEAGLAELRSGGAVKQIAAGENGTTGTPNPQTTSDADGGLSGAGMAAVVLVAAGAIAAIWYAVQHKSEVQLGGTVVVISPNR